MILPKWLEEKRDNSSVETSENTSNRANYEHAFKKGFNACEEILLPEIKALVAALKYNKNEMSYRLYQIEGRHEVKLTGEMHTAIKMAEEALARWKERFPDG